MPPPADMAAIQSKMPIPLPDWLVGNPYFTAGAGLMGVGAAMSVFRVGVTSLESVLRRQMLMSLEIPSKDWSYQWVMTWMVNQGVHGSRHLGVETAYVKDAAGNHSATFSFVPSIGRHWVRYKNSFIRLERQREVKQMDMSSGHPWETVTLTTFAWNPNLFQELLTEAKAAALEKEDGQTIIYQCYGPEWRPFGRPKTIRPFQSVILDGQTAEQILNDVHDFLATQAWYLERGIPYRRGYLLHGPPGCGKSSYVMALAGQLGYNICILNLGDPSMTDDRLQHLLAVVPPRCLVLLEDIDFAVSGGKPADPSGPYAGVTRTSFSGLLNALDGVVATEERIIFMTTNHHKSLPRALIRPGRVDLSIYIGTATAMQNQKMFTRFFPGEDEMAKQFGVLADGEHLSMAELQGFFMFFKGNPARALAESGPWLEARREAHAEMYGQQAPAQPVKDEDGKNQPPTEQAATKKEQPPDE